MKKQERGITLIALIITIVVLLILAVVAIQSVKGDGIIVHALGARESHFKAQAQEEVQLALDNLKIESSIREADEVAYLQSKLGTEATNIKTTGKGNFTLTYKGYEVVVENYGIASVQKIEQGGEGTEVNWEEVFANAQRHPEQDSTIPEIGIDMYGNAVNLGKWNYEFNETDKTFATGKGAGSTLQVGYAGEISSEGKIIGEIPQYIIKDNQKYTLTSLEAAFSNIVELKIAPEIPNTVIMLGNAYSQAGAFKGCKNLEVAPKIPNSVRNMDYTFYGCTSLTTVSTIPNLVTDMDYTFYDCTSLTTVPTIPNSVTDMRYTFVSCTSLTTAPTIPNSVTDLSGTFMGCTSLTTAPTIPNLVTNMSATFSSCELLTTAPIIPNSVTNMNATFSGCTSLTTAPTIPGSVTNLENTFKACGSLTGKLTINANDVSLLYECLDGTATNDGCNLIVSGTCPQLDEIIATKSENSHITKGN